MYPHITSVIGNGVVVNPATLIRELDMLASKGIDTLRVRVSRSAHVIMPYHVALDRANEARLAGAKVGTTGRGIGPTYGDRAWRLGLRMEDLLDREVLRERIGRALPDKNLLLGAMGAPGFAVEPLVEQAAAWGERLRDHLDDSTWLVQDALRRGDHVLLEGAQGALLDLDHGSYPFVTSSSTVAGGLCAGLGISPRRVDQIAGVFKAYCSRVGSGPMPTELNDGPQGFGELLRQRGREFGTVTGRARRTGWFDGVAAAYANRINRFDAVCVMLLDVLDALDEIPVCTGYMLDGKPLRTFPATNAEASRIEPVFETLPGWHSDTTKIVRWEDLPKAALHYLDRLGQIIGAEVALVSVGPDRAQTIVRPGSSLWRRLA